jgi:hypothetical protein
VELAQRLVVDAQEALGRAFLGHLVLEVPDAVAVRELFVEGTTLSGEKSNVTVLCIDCRSRVGRQHWCH